MHARSVRRVGGPDLLAYLRRVVEDEFGCNLGDTFDTAEGGLEVNAPLYAAPVTVIAKILGVPAEDMDRFEGWSNDIALIVEPILKRIQVENVQRATEELPGSGAGSSAIESAECQNARETPATTPWLRYSCIGMLDRFRSREYPA